VRDASTLRRIFRGLEALYQTESGLDPHDLLVPFDHGPNTPRELLLLREAEDGTLEVGLALDAGLLVRLEALPVDDMLGDESLGDALPVIEGLSHLVYVAEAARQERPISGLELETQAEVDKFAVCLLHRWTTRRADFDRLLERLYYRFELAPLHPDLEERYEQANKTALGFSRSLRDRALSGTLGDVRDALRRFWHAPLSAKRAYARG
jgi:hypothetical protein